MKDQNLNINLDLSKTTEILTQTGSPVWAQGVVLRKVSRFVTGTAEDAILPIPVFYDPVSGEICLETLPKELRDAYKDDTI